MKNTLILLFTLLLIPISTFSQDKITKYYNSKWKELKKNRGTYVRKISKINDSTYLVKDFISEIMILEMKGYYKSITPLVEHGPVEYYDIFGKLIMKGQYCNGEMCGKWFAKNYLDNIQYAELDYNFDYTIRKTTEKKAVDSEGKVNDTASTLPVFPGGQSALLKYVRENIVIPYSGHRKRITGRVWVTFVVNKVGNVENVEIIKSLYKDYDKECVRVIRTIPPWEPGESNGEKVKMSFSMPISFGY